MFVDAASPLTGSLLVHVQLDGPADAPPLVLLHSLGTQAAVWEPQAEALAATTRVIRPDMRGHGLTEVTPGPYTIDGLAADTLATLDALGIHSFHLAGISIGGLIAQAIAARAPARIRALVLVDTALAIPPADLWRARAAQVREHGMPSITDPVLARWLTPARQTGPMASALRSMLLRTAPEGYAGAAEAIAAADQTAATKQIRLPTHVVVGEGDQATPVAAAQAIADAIPGATLTIIKDAAHIPTIEQADAVTAVLRLALMPRT